MSQDSSRIPWASMAVMATFVSGTLIVPKAFDLLRPPEKERAQQFSGADLEVDARLWEDPFGAVRRHESERIERCKNPAAASKRECDAQQRDQRRSPQSLRRHLDGNGDGEIDAQSTLLIAVLVPGNPFVGAEEARRRTRFALLSGLQAEGYFPDSAEQIGLMQVPLAPITALAPLTRQASHRQPAAAGTSAPAAAPIAPAAGGDTMMIPYELLSRSRNLRAADEPPRTAARTGSARRPYESVAVVWVDEAALSGPKLDGVARLMDTVIACSPQQPCPRLAVIGPSSSDGMDLMLHGLEAALARRASAPDNIDLSLANGYRLLGQAHFYSPAATISDEDLPLLHRYNFSVQEFFTAYFAGIVPERARLTEAEREVQFTRTIGADNIVATLLAGEVLQRLPAKGKRRVVTIVESDSIYARGLERRMRHLLANGGQISRIDQAYFFRGIDGVTSRDGADRQPPATKGKNDSDAVEWPEARDQLDYLRRMAEELKESEGAEGGGPIGAIGIFANDVHDKLLVLQALHDTFPDKVFFTTDMDARFVHPRVLPFTRNLVVASSLPLKMPPLLEAAPDGGLVRSVRQVQEGTPPLRDVYQTAAYLAARMAACTRACELLESVTQAAIQSPSVYEIGRGGAVAIGGYDATLQRQQRPGAGTALAVVAGLAVMLIGLLVWPSTPALRQTRDRWWRWPGSSTTSSSAASTASSTTAEGAVQGGAHAPASGTASVLTLLYGLWAGFATASVMETAAPYSLGLTGALAWSALGALAAALLTPKVHALLAGSGSTTRRRLLRIGAVLVLAAALAGALSLIGPALPGQGEPLRWLDGISGWPSHYLHLVAILVVLVSIDIFWQRASESTAAEALWLGMPAWAMSARTVEGDKVQRARAWWRRHALLSWRLPAPGSVDFAHVWRHFTRLNEPAPRFIRVLFWYAVTVAGAASLFTVLTGSTLPEVPVRGAEHRALVVIGLLAALAALPALVLAVADATLATCLLLLALCRGRSLYPPEVVARFARELGPEHERPFMQPLAANPGDRGHETAPRDAAPPDAGTPAHSLLDDWIDIQLVARQTQAVAPLIVAPFLVLGLLVMARSRLFDSWAVTWPLALTAAVYLLWLMGLAVGLKLSAERLRTDALARMRADLLWLSGAGQGREKLAEPFKQLIAAVENTTTGAFAPLLDQPLVAALMVPLGSAGGVQLFDHLLLAR